MDVTDDADPLPSGIDRGTRVATENGGGIQVSVELFLDVLDRFVNRSWVQSVGAPYMGFAAHSKSEEGREGKGPGWT